MGTILLGLTITTIIVIAIPLTLVLVQAGIRQQERTGSLTSRPPGRSAALTRRICGMHADPPGKASRSGCRARQADGESALVPSKNGPAAS